jgi:beta-lactamase regulating signal transducer with metallopeptidase domain
MASELLVLTLFRAQAAMSLAVVLILALRAPARRRIGAYLTYRLWLLAPAAAFVSPFPTLSEFLHRSTAAPAPSGLAASIAALCLQAFTADAAWSSFAPWIAGVSGVGALALASLFGVAELRFRHDARLGLAGPAMVGVAAPRFVTPRDYRQRFSERERDLILRHERAHIAHGDPMANLLMAVFQVMFWFNPLIHLAAAQVKLDQELACDARVIEGRPKARRAYAQALMKAHLVKAHLAGPQSALVCAWTARIALARSPLEQRLRALSRCEVSLARYIAGVIAVGGLAVAVSAGVWIAAPAQRYDASAAERPQGGMATVLSLQLSRR